jgi:hypothetical protein
VTATPLRRVIGADSTGASRATGIFAPVLLNLRGQEYHFAPVIFEKIVCCAEDASIRPQSPVNSHDEQESDTCGDSGEDDVDDQHDISQAGDRASSASEALGVQQRLADNGFSRPLRAISELTGFPNLTYL